MADTITHISRPQAEKTARQNWSGPETQKTFSADDLIDAFMLGHKKGRDHESRVLQEKLRENAVAALSAAEDFVAIAQREFALDIKEAFLRIDGITDFTVLLLIPEEQYVSDVALAAYRFAGAKERQLRSGTFCVRFSFAAET